MGKRDAWEASVGLGLVLTILPSAVVVMFTQAMGSKEWREVSGHEYCK